jgi:(2R)-3-sulfolactate dehydrogenase (NADP+)
LAEAEALAVAAFVASRISAANGATVARALVAAEADGQGGHGLSRIPSYALHARCGKADGFATPQIARSGSALRIDAKGGFFYPAYDAAIQPLVSLARENGIAVAAFHRSHHFGQAGAHVEKLANEGLIGLLFGNAPQAMAFWGGKKPMLGTNPIAFAAPLPNRAPLVIDMALSTVARGKIMAAQKAGKSIPGDWALDSHGNPTTDADAAMKGSMMPIGGAKGASLALMVEILAAALTGSAFGWEASSFFDGEGGPPNVGQTLLALDPEKLSGGAFAARMGVLLQAIAAEPGVRLPGERRLAARAKAAKEGVSIPPALHAEIQALIANPA